jgi:hypothetical protein
MANDKRGLRRRLGKLAGLLGGLTVLWACNAPSFPVPPPNPTFTPVQGSTTSWITTGPAFTPAANARYSIVNVTGAAPAGVILTAQSDGSYTAPPITGNVDDHIVIYYETPGGDFSEAICRLLEVGPSDPTRACSP